MNHAQKMPFISTTDFASNQPNRPAISAPTTPLGMPRRWGTPKAMAEMRKDIACVNGRSKTKCLRRFAGVGSDEKLYVNFFIVLDRWKRFVKVVKKFLPLLVPGRLTEPYGVVFQFLPLH